MFDTVIELFVEGKYLAFALAIVLGLIFNAHNILAFADRLKKRRIELLKEAADLSTISENLKRHFEDELEGEYFRLSHKARMDKGIRDACIELYSRVERRISFTHFIRARSHLELHDGRLLVNISIFHKIGYYYNMIAGTGMSLVGFSLITIVSSLQQATALHVLIWLGMCVFLMMFGFFMLSQTFSVYSAKKIREFSEK
ncbi:MAG: hypothetical protein PVI97_06575 [Candidatus Thiodiazotropha sp.]|jgi:hypothetical protein